MDEEQLTPEQRRAMLDMLEQAALNDYPNPKRIGCPGSDFLKRLATNRNSIELSNPSLDHVAHCSPCFAEFVQYRDSVKRNLMTRRVALGIGAAAAAVAALTLKNSISPARQHLAYETAQLDLSKSGPQRGLEPQSTVAIPSLPRRPLDLSITLPFASPAGEYEIQVLHSNGNPTGLKAGGNAHISADGKTILPIRIDLSSLPPDDYQIGYKAIKLDEVKVPVQVR